MEPPASAAGLTLLQGAPALECARGSWGLFSPFWEGDPSTETQGSRSWTSFTVETTLPQEDGLGTFLSGTGRPRHLFPQQGHGMSSPDCKGPRPAGDAANFLFLHLVWRKRWVWVNALYFYLYWASLVAQMVKNLPAMWETWVWYLGREDPLEKGMATHSSILAWRIPGTEESGQSSRRGSKLPISTLNLGERQVWVNSL